jgi:hypothetical protein
MADRISATRSTAIAIRAGLCLDKIRNMLHAYSFGGIDAPGRPGDVRPWLFENVRDHNPPRELETEADFLIGIARNPLKSPDSEKLNASKR